MDLHSFKKTKHKKVKILVLFFGHLLVAVRDVREGYEHGLGLSLVFGGICRGVRH